MTRYGAGVYGASKYGETPRLAYSVEPMSITVLDFDKVRITWQQPSGTFSQFRIVRNQWGFPETAEDGEIIYEQSSTDGSSIQGQIPFDYFTDGVDNPDSIPLTMGSQIYYRVFLFNSSKVWVSAGSITDIVPEDTGATKKTLDLLPRVITSKENTPFGVVEETTPIYQFLDSISFSYEQMRTQLSLLRPQHNRDKSVYNLLPISAFNLGLNSEPNIPEVNQHRLIREAIYLYKNRGTQLGIQDYAESLTGYSPSATVSPNLMLSIQDSTFYSSIGNWTATNGALSSSTDLVPDTSVTTCIDGVYTCKIVATGAGSMTIGLDAPRTKGVPVLPNTNYILSVKVKSPTSAGSITPTILYYDMNATLLSTNNGSATSANNTWKVASVTKVSDATASYAGLKLAWSASGTYYVDMVCMQTGTSVSYDEARAVTLTLSPTKINYIENPSFEVDSSKWTLTNLSFAQDTNVPSDGYSGTYSGKFVSSGSWTLACNTKMTVDPGSYFTVSHYMQSPAMTSMTAYIDLYDASDNLVDTVSNVHDLTMTNGGMWMRGYTTILVPSSSTATYAKYRIQGTAGTLYLDMVQGEDTFKPTDYFDGSMPSQYGVVWAGTAHSSESYMYPNKLTKIPRLANTLNDWMPMNTWWRVQTLAGVEYTNLQV